MQKQFTFRHMETSQVMEDYANQQLAKIEHFLENEPLPIVIELVGEPSKVRQHPRVTLHVITPHYDEFVEYEHTGVSFYEALDHVIDVMYERLHDKKRKLVDERKWIGRHDEFKKQR